MRTLNKLFLLAISTFPLMGCGDTSSVGKYDINAMMDNLRASIPDLERFVFALAFIMGVWFVYSAIMKLRIYGEARVMSPTNANFSGPAIKLFTGVLLIALPSFVQITLTTIWGSPSLLSYDAVGITSSEWYVTEMTLLGIVRVIGFIAFVRGLVMLKSSAQQQAPHGIMGKGLVHLVGGIFCINIAGTISVVQATFGL